VSLRVTGGVRCYLEGRRRQAGRQTLKQTHFQGAAIRVDASDLGESIPMVQLLPSVWREGKAHILTGGRTPGGTVRSRPSVPTLPWQALLIDQMLHEVE
jgi:hypothetical protein